MNQLRLKYSDIPAELQDAIIAFLQEPRHVWMLAGAVEVRKPPVGAIEREFQREFADRINQLGVLDRTKQFTGAVIRVILEANGYEWVSYNHPVGGSGFFSKGSKYRLRR